MRIALTLTLSQRKREQQRMVAAIQDGPRIARRCQFVYLKTVCDYEDLNPARAKVPSKGDPEKLKLALRLRAETAMTLKWIAQHMQIGD